MIDWYGVRCLDHLCFELLPAFGLQEAKPRSVLVDGGVEALRVKADEQQSIGMIQEGSGVGECNLAVAIRAGVGSNSNGGFGEEVIFKGRGAVETPKVVGYGFGDVEFRGVGRRELADEFAAEGFVSGGIFVRQQGELPSQAMLHRVAADCLTTCGAAGPAGFFSVAAIGGELLP